MEGQLQIGNHRQVVYVDGWKFNIYRHGKPALANTTHTVLTGLARIKSYLEDPP
jgi:hypothetical protein